MYQVIPKKWWKLLGLREVYASENTTFPALLTDREIMLYIV